MKVKVLSLLVACGFILVMLIGIGGSVYYENKRGVFVRQLVNELRPKIESQGIKVDIPGYYHKDRLDVIISSPQPLRQDVIETCIGNDFVLSAETIGDCPNYIFTKHPEFIREIRVVIKKERPVSELFERTLEFCAEPGQEATNDIFIPMFSMLSIIAVFLHFKSQE